MSADEAGRQLWAALHAHSELERHMVYWWPARWERLPPGVQAALHSVAHEVRGADREQEP